jgi:sialate O-acetylesterase
MKNLLRLCALCAFVVNLPAAFTSASASPSSAALTLGPLFTDGAVFQREKPLAIYGTADAGATITVAFAGATATAQAGTGGRWTATLPAQPASAAPQTLAVTTSAGEKIEVRDILVGEVWLASGQSNMEWMLARTANAAAEIAAAADPQIRMVRVPLNPQPAPAAGFDRPLVWQEAAPKNARAFSATAWFFAKELRQKLGVPVGIINAAWGGKMIEVFISEKTLGRPGFKKVRENYAAETRRFQSKVEAEKKLVADWEAEKAAAENAGRPFSKKYPLGNLTARAILDQHRPSCLFNGGIAPLGAFPLRGIIWYQGEHNTMRAAEYPPLLAALIADWRAFLAQGDIPFYFCQLSGYGAPMDRSGESYARLREAQRQIAAAGIPNTAMAVTIDLGEKTDVHFKNKQPVGHRLALLARHFIYNENDIEYSGPVLTKAARAGAAVKLTFAHAAGLQLKTAVAQVSQASKPASAAATAATAATASATADASAAAASAVSAVVATSTAATGFELAGADNIFHPATAKIENDTITLVSDAVPSPAVVRYAWGNFPAAAPLRNAAGLPASPFVEAVR